MNLFDFTIDNEMFKKDLHVGARASDSFGKTARTSYERKMLSSAVYL